MVNDAWAKINTKLPWSFHQKQQFKTEDKNDNLFPNDDTNRTQVSGFDTYLQQPHGIRIMSQIDKSNPTLQETFQNDQEQSNIFNLQGPGIEQQIQAMRGGIFSAGNTPSTGLQNYLSVDMKRMSVPAISANPSTDFSTKQASGIRINMNSVMNRQSKEKILEKITKSVRSKKNSLVSHQHVKGMKSNYDYSVTDEDITVNGKSMVFDHSARAKSP